MADIRKTFKELTIPCSDTSMCQYLRPSAFLCYTQEIGNDNSDVFHFGYDDLIKENRVWIILRMHYIFFSYPRWRDRLILSTWSKGVRGPYWLRDFRLEDLKGNVVALATSHWTLLDMKERTHVDPSKEKAGWTDATLEEDAITEPCPRLVQPPLCEMEECGIHKVAFSDIDRNGHANNAMYLSWAMDAVDMDFAQKHPVREMFINFRTEALAGEEVHLYRKKIVNEKGAAECVVEGLIEGRLSFITRLIFAPEPLL